MESTNRTQAKIAAELASLLEDEKAHLAKFTRTSFWIKLVGIACLLIGLAIATMPWHSPTAAAVLFAAVGGFLAGLSVAYDSPLQSWPIIKPLLKENALELLTGRGNEST